MQHYSGCQPDQHKAQQVGNGRSIRVFTHDWLSHSPVPLNEASVNMWVCDLIDQDTRQWDRGKIYSTFAHQTQTEILVVPLNNIKLRGLFDLEGKQGTTIHSQNSLWSCVAPKGPTKGWTLNSLDTWGYVEGALDLQGATESLKFHVESLLKLPTYSR